MQHTPNFNFDLPEASDYAGPANNNFTIIDDELSKRDVIAETAAKAAPVDADSVVMVDSADDSKTKRVLWSSIKTALGTVFAALSHTHAAEDITSGEIPVERGGTAGATAAEARSNLGAASTATYTAATASDSWTQDATNGWYSQAVAVAGLLDTDTPLCDCVLTGDHDADLLIAEAWALVTRVVAAADAVTFYAYGDAPTVAFSVKMEVVRDG